MELTVTNLQKKVRISPPRVIRLTKAVLRREKVRQAALAIVFVSRPKIRALNKKYLKRDYATDVLAFDAGDGPAKDWKAGKARKAQRRLEGDIIISADEAVTNARRFGTSARYELSLYVVHGILHLLGYDDHAAKDIARMRKKEREIMSYLGFDKNPSRA